MWVIWKTLDLQMGPALDQFERWGVKGIKVDFMQREDQWMVNYYERVAREAAKRKMLVDFHGAYKPAGLYRTWPKSSRARACWASSRASGATWPRPTTP
jgi:alpha-glucosidase